MCVPDLKTRYGAQGITTVFEPCTGFLSGALYSVAPAFGSNGNYTLGRAKFASVKGLASAWTSAAHLFCGSGTNYTDEPSLFTVRKGWARTSVLSCSFRVFLHLRERLFSSVVEEAASGDMGSSSINATLVFFMNSLFDEPRRPCRAEHHCWALGEPFLLWRRSTRSRRKAFPRYMRSI